MVTKDYYGYKGLVEASLKVGEKQGNPTKVIKPGFVVEKNPQTTDASLLYVDAKKNLQEEFNPFELLKLSKFIYGDLEKSKESREKFAHHLQNSLDLFKKASHGYFEERYGKEWEKFETNLRDLIKNPDYEKILKLFFAGEENSSFSNTYFARGLLLGTLPAVHVSEFAEDYDNLDEVQEKLRTEIEGFLTKDKGIRGVHKVKVKEVLGNPKSLLRLLQKLVTKANLTQKDIPDSVRVRLILEVEKGENEKEILKKVAEKIKGKLKRRQKNNKSKNVKLEAPGDGSRTEFKVEGLIEGKTFEISIMDVESYERDEKYGPYDHEIYEFIKGDAVMLARWGMLEKGYIERRITELSKLDSWKKIPNIAYEKISRDFGKIIKEQKEKGSDIEKTTVTTQKGQKQNREKFFTIPPKVAKALIRKRLSDAGFLLDPRQDQNRYFLMQQAIDKQFLAEKPEAIYELQRVAEKIMEVVNSSPKTKEKIDANTAMSIILGQTYKVSKKILEIIKKDIGIKIP